MEALPPNIRNLPTYIVSTELFVCTTILLFFLLIAALVVTVTWIIRSCKHIHNYQYIPNHQFRYYRQKKIEQVRVDDQQVLNQNQDQFTETQSSNYKEEIEIKYKEFNRNQSRFLEFVCLSVVMVININAYSSKAFELIAYGIALILFIAFNIFRGKQVYSKLRLLFLIPLLVAYIPFYIPNKNLET